MFVQLLVILCAPTGMAADAENNCIICENAVTMTKWRDIKKL